MPRASLAQQTQRVNLAVRGLQQQRSPEAIVSALVVRSGVSRRQAYRYLALARSHRQLRPAPAPKAVFTVRLPRRLIQAVRARCRRQGRPLSQIVTELLERWLSSPAPHG